VFTILLFYKESPTKAFPSFSLSKTRKDMRRDTHASSLAYMTAGHLHHSPRVTFIFPSNKEIESCFGSHNKLKSGNCCAGKIQSIHFLFVSASAASAANLNMYRCCPIKSFCSVLNKRNVNKGERKIDFIFLI